MKCWEHTEPALIQKQKQLCQLKMYTYRREYSKVDCLIVRCSAPVWKHLHLFLFFEYMY